MRELVEEVNNFYSITEALSKEPSSPVTRNTDLNTYNTKLTKYGSDTKFEPTNRYHKDYSGVSHTVLWKGHKSSEAMSPKERKDTLHDAMHLHNHYIQHHTEVGDRVSNQPLSDDENSGVKKSGNKRSRIYKAGGFGDMDYDKVQHGIIKQHPDNHPEEEKRGKKYLHPLSPDEIRNHDGSPTAGSSDGKVRRIFNKTDDGTTYSTKYNDIVHHSHKHTIGWFEHTLDSNKTSKDYDASISHHKDHVRSNQ